MSLTLNCCAQGNLVLPFRKANKDPEKDGWCLDISANFGYGDPCFDSINFCPFCGEKIPQIANMSNKSEDNLDCLLNL